MAEPKGCWEWLLGIVFVLLGGAIPAFSQGFTVQNAQSVLNDMPQHLETAQLSPDGSKIAWISGKGICLTDAPFETSDCYPYPPDLVTGGVGLTWSADSRYLVTTENFFLIFIDSDLWQFDTESLTYAHLTDEGFYGGILNKSGFLIDVLPTYDANGDLYFIRYTPVEDSFSTELYQWGDEPKSVFEFDFETPFSIYRPFSFSPDGESIAVIVTPPHPAQQGIGRLKNGEFEMVVGIDELLATLPEWETRDNWLIERVSWSGDDWVVYMQNYNFGSALGFWWVYVSADGQVTSLADFSDVDSYDALYQRNENGDVPYLRLPQSGVVLGSEFVSLHSFTVDTDLSILWSQSLPPDGSEPQEIGRIFDYDYNFRPFIMSASVDDKRIFGRGYVIDLE